MLFDPMNVLKAKKYEVVEEKVKGDQGNAVVHLIRPVGTEASTVQIDPIQLVKDFITLIGEYAKCPHLRSMIKAGPESYKGRKEKGEQNRITIQNRHYHREESLMQDALIRFVNKYGLMGLLNDGAVGFDYYKPKESGSWEGSEYDLMKYPDSVVTSRAENGPYERESYEKYIESYFPGCAARDAAELTGAARVLQYSEYMEDILQNRRFLDCVEYIAGIDKGRRAPLSIYDLKATLSFKEDAREYDVQSRSLIQYCHTMFFLNELGAGEKHVCICQYRLCHRPFMGNRRYCSEACMRNANKAKKKGAKDDGKETR